MYLVIYDELGSVIEQTVQIESPIVGEFSILSVSLKSSSNNLKGHFTYYGSEGEMDSYELIVYQP